jgi:hypothetical protein
MMAFHSALIRITSPKDMDGSKSYSGGLKAMKRRPRYIHACTLPASNADGGPPDDTLRGRAQTPPRPRLFGAVSLAAAARELYRRQSEASGSIPFLWVASMTGNKGM